MSNRSLILRENNELEGYDLIDENSDQSHDGDGAKEVIATIYDKENAGVISIIFERILNGELVVQVKKIGEK